MYVVVGELALAKVLLVPFQHSRLAARGEWVLNEKEIIQRAGPNLFAPTLNGRPFWTPAESLPRSKPM